jgi:hypothetical protein
MYYITNETGQIIAADEELLSHCGATDVSGLSVKVLAGETVLTSPDANSVTITTNGEEHHFSASKSELSSMLGHMTLFSLEEVQGAHYDDLLSTDTFILDTLDEDTEKSTVISEPETLEIDEPISFETPIEEETLSLDTDEAISFDTPDDENEIELFEIMESADEKTEIEETESPELDTDELFTLMEDDDTLSKDLLEENGEIIVDVAHNSEDIGISDEDYALFLNEYIDTALALETDLQSDDMVIRNRAIDTLTDLSEVMRIPEISAIMRNIHVSTPEQQKGYMGSLYTTLSRLTTQSSSNAAMKAEAENIVSTEEAVKETIVEKVPNPNGFGTVDLSDVKPKHFDFQLEEAANDLSLPVELIEEFVHDFIEQAHVETKKMLEAYEEGDLPKIQAIGHLLKGASSNLRINTLSDTLYKIQFCESENGLDDLIKDYWAHFLSFETQINVISH